MTVETIDQIFGFGIGYETRLVLCEVIMQDGGYEILFNGKNVAEIIMDDNMEWRQSNGYPLGCSLIYEIGFKIVSKYN